MPTSHSPSGCIQQHRLAFCNKIYVVPSKTAIPSLCVCTYDSEWYQKFSHSCIESCQAVWPFHCRPNFIIIIIFFFIGTPWIFLSLSQSQCSWSTPLADFANWTELDLFVPLFSSGFDRCKFLLLLHFLFKVTDDAAQVWSLAQSENVVRVRNICRKKQKTWRVMYERDDRLPCSRVVSYVSYLWCCLSFISSSLLSFLLWWLMLQRWWESSHMSKYTPLVRTRWDTSRDREK